MLGTDFAPFWKAACAVLAGQSPYTVDGFYSPFPFAWLMIPFGLLPFRTALSLWTALNLASLIVLAKRDTFKLMLFLPVAFALWVGQMDLLIIAAGFGGGWLGLAFTTLKPQLAIWMIPYTFAKWGRKGEWKNILRSILAIIALYGIPSLAWPGWWLAWIKSPPSILAYAEHASSLFGLAALIKLPAHVTFYLILALAVLSLILTKPFADEKFWNWAAIFNPVSNLYSLSILIKNVDWVAVGLSWLLLPVAFYWHTGFPWVAVPIYLWVRPRIFVKFPLDSKPKPS